MTTLLLLIAVVLACGSIVALGLMAGLRLTRARRRHFGWALLATLTAGAGWAAAYWSLGFFAFDEEDILGPILTLAGLAAAALAWSVLVLWLLLRTDAVQLAAGVSSAVPAVALVCVLWVLVIRTWVVEISYLRSNSMAPTLLALHHVGTCPHCGGRAYVPFTTVFDYEPADARYGMCGDCHRLCCVRDCDSTIRRSDRFVINKLIPPRRWDLVVYRDPFRQVRFAKRVVGLPGETVVIEAGRVLIDGQPVPLPAELEGLEFSLFQMDGRPALWGTPEHPAQLGADEYFVLDDFSIRGHDSRMWTTALPGRAPYALPRSSIEGVVGLICWPQERIRLLR
jgi:signal peptidase I